MMSAAKHATLFGFVLVGLIGCDDGKAWRTADSWYRPPQRRLHGDEHPLPDADIHEVIAEKLAVAEQQLQEASCVEISDESASALAGQTVERDEGKSLYLVRGVYLNRGTGTFTVALIGGDLLVYHASLGHNAVDMKRQPLIVPLPQQPDQVFVSCSMAE